MAGGEGERGRDVVQVETGVVVNSIPGKDKCGGGGGGGGGKDVSRFKVRM